MNGREVKYCKSCMMPDSRPRIQFNKDGISSVLSFNAGKKIGTTFNL